MHDKKNQKFIMDIKKEEAKVEYTLRNGKMYLTHSDVPNNLRGSGVG